MLTCQIPSSHECIIQGNPSEKNSLNMLHHHFADDTVIYHFGTCVLTASSLWVLQTRCSCRLVSFHDLLQTWQVFNFRYFVHVFSLYTFYHETAAPLFFPLAGRHHNPGHRLLLRQMWGKMVIPPATTPCMHDRNCNQRNEPSLPQICLLISIYFLSVLTSFPIFQLCFWRLQELWGLALFHSSIGIDSCFLLLNAMDMCI